jgi:hypothetical protein
LKIVTWGARVARKAASMNALAVNAAPLVLAPLTSIGLESADIMTPRWHDGKKTWGRIGTPPGSDDWLNTAEVPGAAFDPHHDL